jgi:acyl carrier protein
MGDNIVSVEALVIKSLAEILQKDISEITLEKTLQGDLEVDSLDTVELLMEAEEYFNIDIDSTEINPEEIVTVADMIAFVESKLDN